MKFNTRSNCFKIVFPLRGSQRLLSLVKLLTLLAKFWSFKYPSLYPLPIQYYFNFLDICHLSWSLAVVWPSLAISQYATLPYWPLLNGRQEGIIHQVGNIEVSLGKTNIDTKQLSRGIENQGISNIWVQKLYLCFVSGKEYNFEWFSFI